MIASSGLDVYVARPQKPLYNAKFAITTTVYQDYVDKMQTELNETKAKTH